MNPSLLIFTISAYILSLVLALILTFSSKKINSKHFKYAAAFHFALLVFMILLFLLKKETSAFNYLSILTFCSALSLSGWAIRITQLNKVLKLYFGITLLSVLLFIWSPSKLFYIVSANANLIKDEKEFRLQDNYYLVEQQSMFHLNAEIIKYKVIEKLGMFNKTIARDINLKGKPEKIKLILFTEDTLVIRTFVTSSDSFDLGIKPGMKDNTITQIRSKK